MHTVTTETETQAINCNLENENLLEKVIATIYFAVAGEALFSEIAFAFTALNALGVPGSIQDIEQPAIQNGQFTACTLSHLHGHHAKICFHLCTAKVSQHQSRWD